MKHALLTLTATALSVATAATNLVSNTVTVTNRCAAIVTYTMSNGVARVQDPSGKLIGTAEERALKVAAEGQADIASAAADAAGTAMEEWREFTATTDVKVCYIDAGFSQDLPALATNLCGWVAGSFYDSENGEDHYYIWFNREMDAPPAMCARIVSERGTNWLDGTWKDWAVTNWIDKATGREWARPYGARVEYLESHGAEWINPEFAPSSDTLKVVIDTLVTHSGDHIAFGILSNDKETLNINWYQGHEINLRFLGFSYAFGGYRNRSVIEMSRGGGYINGNKVCDFANAPGSFSGTRKITLFGRANSAEPTGIAIPYIGKIWSFVCEQNGEKVIDLLPVLDLSDRPAMYDEVSGQLFYNQGTGEFTWGETLDAPVPCRELIVPRRNANCVLKTGTVITLGGRDGFDADIHKINIEVGGTPTPTTSAQLPLFHAVTYSGTNRVVRAYTNGFVNVENGFVKEPSNE